MVNIKPKRELEIKKMLCGCEKCSNIDSYFTNLKKLGEEYENDEKIKSLAAFSLALNSPERLIILKVLNEKDRCVCELESILNKSQSTISHHLRKLVSANLIKGWKIDKFTYYSLQRNKLNKNLSLLNEVFSS